MKIDAKKKYLLICESPNKVKTLTSILRNQLNYSNIVVTASAGHIVQIADTGEYNMGIDPKDNFKANFKIIEGKTDLVKKLKEQVKAVDEVILATDMDREGEAIAYHLATQLKIPEKKLNRITYHEITKSAIQRGIDESRGIDYDLVSAAISRAKVDKIIGYRLSGIARANVGARSVGRCQSAGLKLLVEREEEIAAFVPEKYFDLYLHFKKNTSDFTAKYIGTVDKEIKSLPTLDACKAVVSRCENNPYIITDIVHKDSTENPKPPFTTSTFQQEVTKRLGISVKSAMDYAQKLFEGIDINGQHIPLITYLRTDCSDVAPEFADALKEYVTEKFGKEYYAPVRKGKKGENAQEGHEALRCIDLNLTPDKAAEYIIDERMLKVYTIIYNRTLASSMKPAIIANTIYTINNNDDVFTMTSKELKFDGYKKVYNYTDDNKSDTDQIVKETFRKKETLKETSLEAIEKETKPPVRYDESSFVKELDKQGIGRPSTYASIVQVLLDPKRGYCETVDKKIKPTDLGIRLSHFLDKAFPDVINIKYTAELEKELDSIAKGTLDGVVFLSDFYSKLEEAINEVGDVKKRDFKEMPVCPNCGKPMQIKRGRYSLFYGCTGYPECMTTLSINKV